MTGCRSSGEYGTRELSLEPESPRVSPEPEATPGISTGKSEWRVSGVRVLGGFVREKREGKLKRASQ